MNKVAAGCYRRGSNQTKTPPDRRPEHTVCVSTFHMDKFEVTVNAYKKCVAAKVCSPPTPHNPRHRAHRFCNWGAKGKGKHPLNCVDWFQAETYCKWAGKRLPSEAEWEYAALGKDGRAFPWGNERAGFCNYAVVTSPDTGKRGCGTNATWPAGSLPAGKSPFGLLDMVGNVAEWVQDCYEARFYARCGARCKDPVNACTNRAGRRAYRGSSWATPYRYFDPRRRGSTYPGARIWGVGFRCAR